MRISRIIFLFSAGLICAAAGLSQSTQPKCSGCTDALVPDFSAQDLFATEGQAQCVYCSSVNVLFGLPGPVNFQIAVSSAGWLSASPLSGTATPAGTGVTVTANPAGLAPAVDPNPYVGSLTISCVAPSSCDPVSVAVYLYVSPMVTLGLSPSAVSFTDFPGRPIPPAQTVTVSSSFSSPLSFMVSRFPAWLSVSPLSGTTGASSVDLSLTANPSAVPAGGAMDSVSITYSPGFAVANKTAVIDIPVSFSFGKFSVSANPSPLTVSVPSGGTRTVGLSIGTADSNAATVSFAVSGSAAVQVNPRQATIPGAVSVTANAAGLTPGTNPSATITVTCAAANPCAPITVPVQLDVTAGPLPSLTPGGIVPLYSTANTVEPGEWISIFGKNLALDTYQWKGDFPQSLGGTSVTIDGKAGYLSFASPAQINVQVPNDSSTGTVLVAVTTPSGTVYSTTTLGEFAPALSLLGDNKHAAGIIYRSGGAYDIVGPTGNSLGYATVAARPGDTIALFGVGFGPTNPSVPAGQAFTGQAKTNSPVTMLINNVSVPLLFSGLSGAGLYQFNFVLPPGLGTGDVPVTAVVGGVQTQSGVVIAVDSN